MIEYEEYILTNGLTVIIHPDFTTPMVTVNLLYKVGSRNEISTQTGYAHLLEHLMFEGSENVSNFDEELERAGGENNAWTTTDLTNYYITLPHQYLDTALWLESDRMLNLSLDQESFDIQKSVVIEEFKEQHINPPYGDIWHKLMALCYTHHPYQWPTIGLNLSHIQEAQLKDIKKFYHTYYSPNNAVLVVAGNLDIKKTKEKIAHWFENIPNRNTVISEIIQEPAMIQSRRLDVEADVPLDCLIKAYPMAERTHKSYFAADLLSDYIGSGESSLLFNKLVRDTSFCASVSSYVTGTIDKGLFVIDLKINQGVSVDQVEEELLTILNSCRENFIPAREIEKLHNQMESYDAYADLNVANRASNLAFYSYLGDTNLINSEIQSYHATGSKEIFEEAQNLFRSENTCSLYYRVNS